MRIGRNIGDQEAAAREEREAGIGWEVYSQGDGATIIGMRPQAKALQHAGFPFRLAYASDSLVNDSPADVWIPHQTASEVVAALRAIDYGARVVDAPDEIAEACERYRAELVRQLVDLGEDPAAHTAELGSEVDSERARLISEAGG